MWLSDISEQRIKRKWAVFYCQMLFTKRVSNNNELFKEIKFGCTCWHWTGLCNSATWMNSRESETKVIHQERQKCTVNKNYWVIRLSAVFLHRKHPEMYLGEFVLPQTFYKQVVKLLKRKWVCAIHFYLNFEIKRIKIIRHSHQNTF